jgi:hypothetical protein
MKRVLKAHEVTAAVRVLAVDEKSVAARSDGNHSLWAFLTAAGHRSVVGAGPGQCVRHDPGA